MINRTAGREHETELRTMIILSAKHELLFVSEADGDCRRAAAQVPVQALQFEAARQARRPPAPRTRRVGRRLTSLALAFLVSMGALAPASVAAGADAAPRVAHDGGRLSVTAVDVQLATLMQAVGERTGIQVRIAPELDHRVSTTFEGVPLREALRRILQGLVWVTIYAPQGSAGAPAAPREVRIYGRIGQPRPPILVSADKVSRAANSNTQRDPDGETVAGEVAKLDSASVANRLRVVDNLAKLEHATAITALARLLEEDDDPGVRLRALSALRGYEDPSAIAAIERGLGDEDSSIRLRVLDALVDRTGEAAVPILGRVLFGDDDSQMRLKAVQYLAAVPGEASRAFLEAAARDRNAVVRDAAAEVLAKR